MTNDERWARDYFERGYAQRWSLAAPDDRVRLEIEGISKILQLPQTARIVDIGCGHGRYALALAERGLDVVGVDFARALLHRAQSHAQRLRAPVRWIRGDMRRLPLRSECADAAIVMDAFGFFEAEHEHATVLAEAHRILRDGGALLMKVVNGVPILADFRHTAREQRDGVDVSISNALSLDPPRMTQRLAVTGERGEGNYERRQRLYRMEELQGLLEGAGFSVSGVFANAEGAPFDPVNSNAMWIVSLALFPPK
jgi:ubiquinone/menaquinone biosynthesis C-methylase UbiE